MSRIFSGLSIVAFLLAFSNTTHAQDKRALDSVDKVIIDGIIQPAEERAGDEPPQWAVISTQIKMSYSILQADRASTKAKIYFYYGKNWPEFCTALVHFTDAYENREDAKLMNKNANFILEHSTEPKDWKAAQAWVQHVLDKDPADQASKTTYDALSTKLKG